MEQLAAASDQIFKKKAGVISQPGCQKKKERCISAAISYKMHYALSLPLSRHVPFFFAIFVLQNSYKKKKIASEKALSQPWSCIIEARRWTDVFIFSL